MLHIYPDTNVYVYAPVGCTTGGVELLHQLVDFLRDNKKDAYIVYYGKEEHIVPDEYVKYNIEIKEEQFIENNPHHIEVYTETMCDRLIKNNRNTQKFLWWLSVDNFYSDYDKLCLTDIFVWNKIMGKKSLIYRIKRFLHGYNDFRGKISLKKVAAYATCCGYQSEYIRWHLLNNGFKDIVPLFDYINTDYINRFLLEDKENIVLYNPSKGFEYTKQLIALAPDIQWLALKGYTRKQLVDLLRKAKVYIDFGNHPGKDRLPRECAMNGCCIITGKRGSAAYFEDVSIPEDYKFDENVVKKEDIIKKIRWIFNNYTKAIDDLSFYRNKIVGEKEEFEEQIREIFINSR